MYVSLTINRNVKKDLEGRMKNRGMYKTKNESDKKSYRDERQR